MKTQLIKEFIRNYLNLNKEVIQKIELLGISLDKFVENAYESFQEYNLPLNVGVNLEFYLEQLINVTLKYDSDVETLTPYALAEIEVNKYFAQHGRLKRIEKIFADKVEFYMSKMVKDLSEIYNSDFADYKQLVNRYYDEDSKNLDFFDHYDLEQEIEWILDGSSVGEKMADLLKKMYLSGLGEQVESYISDTYDFPMYWAERKSYKLLVDMVPSMNEKIVEQILAKIDSTNLAVCLKDKSEEIKKAWTRTMSKRAAAMLMEDIEFLGPVSEERSSETEIETGKEIKAIITENQELIEQNSLITAEQADKEFKKICDESKEFIQEFLNKNLKTKVENALNFFGDDEFSELCLKIGSKLEHNQNLSYEYLLESKHILERIYSQFASLLYNLKELLQTMDEGQVTKALEYLKETRPKLCVFLRNRIFIFEDLATLDDRMIQRILRDIESVELAAALKDLYDRPVSEELVSKIQRNMSRRASAGLLELMIDTRHTDEQILEARNKIKTVYEEASRER